MISGETLNNKQRKIDTLQENIRIATKYLLRMVVQVKLWLIGRAFTADEIFQANNAYNFFKNIFLFICNQLFYFSQ
jgi:hypothetical protein